MTATDLPAGATIVKGHEERLDLSQRHDPRTQGTPTRTASSSSTSSCPRLPRLAPATLSCTDRLNPILYEDGKVCVGPVGHLAGQGHQTWTPDLTPPPAARLHPGPDPREGEPYSTRPATKKQRGAQQGSENSRMYNEMAVLKLVQIPTKLLRNPGSPPGGDQRALQEAGSKLTARLLRWKAIFRGKTQEPAGHPPPPQHPPGCPRSCRTSPGAGLQGSVCPSPGPSTTSRRPPPPSSQLA